MQKKLLYIPFFPFLLPVFFVLHGYIEHAAYMSLRNCYGLAAAYLLAALIFFGLLYLVYRDVTKAALALGCLQACSFFFGSVQDLLQRAVPFLAQTVVLLPVVTVLALVILVRLKKTGGRLSRLTLFLNTLVLIYLLVDGTKAFFIGQQRQTKLAVATAFQPQQVGPCDSGCRYPDVYLLLMDEYAGTRSLQKWYGYDNSGLDSFLLSQGFHLYHDSHSNYNFTAFSMASILNMSYLEGLPPGNACSVSDYAYCSNLIRGSGVMRQFSQAGYDIVNYSIFDLEDRPSEVNLHLLPVKANLISGQTLWGRVRRDLGPRFYKLPVPVLKDQAYQVMHDNDRFIEGVLKQSQAAASHPRFIYAHLEMPHHPYFLDRNGRLKGPGEAMVRDIRPYLDYLPPTNKVIKKMVDAIQQNTHRSAVIILMGDHGVRYDVPGDSLHTHDFENLNAVFFPGPDYHAFPESINGVNQFRVVLSRIFRQSIPLLPDSTVYLTDRK